MNNPAIVEDKDAVARTILLRILCSGFFPGAFSGLPGGNFDPCFSN
jgi:hypothetical protein